MNESMSERSRGRVGKLGILFVVVGVGVACFFTFSLGTFSGFAEERETSQGETFKPVAPLETIMHHGDDLFQGFETRIEKKQFRSLTRETQVLAELMNIASVHKKEKEWKEFAGKAKDLLVKLSEVSQKKDATAAQPMLGAIDGACEACHKEYRDE